MSKHPDVEKAFFLRSARGDEYEAYASLVAEADAVHHAEMPELIKAPDRARPGDQDFLACLQDPDRLLDFAVEDTKDGRSVVGLVEARVVARDDNRTHEPNTMARIDLIVVKESHRRRGIGRALLARARSWAETRRPRACCSIATRSTLSPPGCTRKPASTCLRKPTCRTFVSRTSP